MPINIFDNEKELLLKIADGDELAFQQLFRMYGALVKANAIKVMQDEALAADLVQEVFLRIWLYRDKLPEVEQPKAWILQITYYQCFNLLRHQKIHKKATLELSMRPVSNNSAEEAVYYEETHKLVRAAISSLPAQMKRIYRLSREEGMKIADIAEQLQLSSQSVKNTLARALKMIRQYLRDHGCSLPFLLLFLIFRG